MSIWDAVSKTDPKHTKHVNQRGGFTAINANAQVMAATKQFGPVGIGWGYETGAPIFTPEGAIGVPVALWHGERSNSYGPELGCADMAGKRLDTDAPKKAVTDGLTKLLSRLGFNADVFLGLYDDQKYVSEMRREFAEPAPTLTDDQRDELIAHLKANNFPLDEFLKTSRITSLNELPAEKLEGAKNYITENKKEAA